MNSAIKKIVLLLAVVILVFSVSCAKKTPEQKLEEALKSLEKQDSLGAIIKLKNIIKEDPKSPVAAEAYMYLGRTYEMQKDLAEARKNYEEVIKLVSHGASLGQQAFESLIMTYVYENKFDEAIAEIDKVIQGVPADTTYSKKLQFEKSTLYLEKNEIDNARAILDKFLFEEQKELGFAQKALDLLSAYYMNSKEYDKGIETFNAFLEKRPDWEDKGMIIVSKSYFYQLKGDKENAEKVFNEGLEGYKKALSDTLDEKEKGAINLQMARSYEIMSKWDEANAIYDEIIKNNQEKIIIQNAYFMKNANLIRMKKYDDSLALLEIIDKQYPDDKDVNMAVQGIRAKINEIKTTGEDGKTSETAVQNKEAAAQNPAGDSETKSDKHDQGGEKTDTKKDEKSDK